MIRNTEAGKHWLKKEEEGGDSSDDKEPEGSEAGQEPAREEGEISNPSECSDETGSSAQCEKVGHSRRFWLHVEFKLAFNNHISKKAILLGVHKQICKLKIWFSKMLLKCIFCHVFYRQRCTNFKQPYLSSAKGFPEEILTMNRSCTTV